MYTYYHTNYICHHGIKGQKWGVRRFQNKDGSLTAAGSKRYGVDSEGNMSEKGQRKLKIDTAKDAYKQSKKAVKQAAKDYNKARSGLIFRKTDIDNIQKSKEAFNKLQEAELDKFEAKVNKKTSKMTNSEKAAKYEKAQYKKKMYDTGLPGSREDYINYGKSTLLSKRIKVKHGEQYVNDIFDSIAKKAKANMGANALLTGDPRFGEKFMNKIAF